MATGNTANYNLPYPVPTDPVDVAGDIEELSNSLDAFLTAPAFIGAVSASTISTGSAVFSGNTSTNLVRITQTGSGNALLVEDSTNPDSTPFVIDSDGDVGIGSASPDARLVVLESGSQTAVRITNTGTGNSLVVEDSANPDSTPFVIDASGNVGIGTTTPISNLHISDGNIVDSGLYTSDYLVISVENNAPGFNIICAANAQTQRGVFKATRSRGTLFSPTVPLDNDRVFSLLGSIYDGNGNNSTAEIVMAVDGNVSDGISPQKIIFSTGETTSRTERMTIKANGNVGIGTTSPAFRHHVAFTTSGSAVATSGTTDSTTIDRINSNVVAIDSGILNSGTSYIQVRNTGDFSVTYPLILQPVSGNVGIGTTSPGAKLQLGNGTDNAYFLQSGSASFIGHSIRNVLDTTSGNSTSYIDAQNQNSVADSHLFFVHESDGGSTIIFGNTPAGSKLSDRRVERMRISSAGNVGIGTSSPATALHIENQSPIIRLRDTEVASTIFSHVSGSGPNGSLTLSADVNNATANSAISLQVDGTERMRIDGNGTVSLTGSTIIMESGTTGAPTDNVFFRVERGTSPDVDIRWNELGDAWQFTNDGTTYYDIPTAAGGGAGLEAVLMFGGM